MKRILITLSLLMSLLLISCDQNEAIVDSDTDTVIQNLSFVVDTTFLDSANDRLVAKGTVKNHGNSKVTSPWYVECQFYTNSSKTTKLGGNYTQIGVPLAKSESTFWTITYSSSNVNVNDYPNFAVGNIRGIYK
ncbi:MAG: hypothetical protein HND39_03245 [Ignavibacteriota bacterium]|nr:hypothetical protein [Ignavibacteriales bacterium]MCL4280582.1 hypothetical protein [Ignavibacteriaceae bacterium]MEB2296576.1 hypothetical protein [Ignavibacteria bacterium]QKJ95367.1 MAG: hypothetical protein HND39_03245 [Ignavibacteriota bacterium]MCZ7615945.1 hypothetical protein [Ignavibacteriaceae bacterium]